MIILQKGGFSSKRWTMIYVDLSVRFYGDEAIDKVNALRFSGVNMTDLFYSAVMTADIEKLQKSKTLSCV